MADDPAVGHSDVAVAPSGGHSPPGGLLRALQVMGQGDAYIVPPPAALRIGVTSLKWIRADHRGRDGVAPAEVETAVTLRRGDAAPGGAAYEAVAECQAALEGTGRCESFGHGGFLSAGRDRRLKREAVMAQPVRLTRNWLHVWFSYSNWTEHITPTR